MWLIFKFIFLKGGSSISRSCYIQKSFVYVFFGKKNNNFYIQISIVFFFFLTKKTTFIHVHTNFKQKKLLRFFLAAKDHQTLGLQVLKDQGLHLQL